MIDVEVSCLPGDLPEYIEVDLLNVALDQTVHLTDLVLPKGVYFGRTKQRRRRARFGRCNQLN